jgi:hypothetical protein
MILLIITEIRRDVPSCERLPDSGPEHPFASSGDDDSRMDIQPCELQLLNESLVKIPDHPVHTDWHAEIRRTAHDLYHIRHT